MRTFIIIVCVEIALIVLLCCFKQIEVFLCLQYLFILVLQFISFGKRNEKEKERQFISLQINSIIAIFLPFIDLKNESCINIFKEYILSVHPEHIELASNNLDNVNNSSMYTTDHYYDYRGKTYRQVCADILKSHKPMKYNSCLSLVKYLFRAAYVSKLLSKQNIILLQNISHYFHINEMDLTNLEYEYHIKQPKTEQRHTEEIINTYPQRNSQACSILGLNENCSLEEVKTKYRQLVKTCHPDTLSKETSKEEREKCTTRFHQITDAYNYLCMIKK